MSKKSTKRLSVGKTIFLVILLIIIMVIAAAGYLLTHYSGLFGDLGEEEIGTSVSDTSNTSTDEQIVETTSIADDVFTILLIGVDSRQDTYTGRSDTQILFSINQKQKKLVITSILRDCYVTIPGQGNNRINAAYALGGTSLLTQTIQNNFGIPVNRCAVVNFKIVEDFVDAVGGVDIDVSEEEIYQINKNAPDSTPLTTAGVNHLNGEQAVSYARIRKTDSDFGRTKRQRTVIDEALVKVGDMSVSEQTNLIEEFLPRVHTDLTRSEVLNLGSMILRFSKYEVQSFAIPIDGTWSDMTVNGMAVLDVDFSTNQKAWEDAVS